VGGLPTKRTVNGFVVSPKDPRVMYATTRDGLFRSTDAGESWKSVGSGIRDVMAVTVNPREPREVYAVSTEGRLYRSADGGTTWAPQR
jgi:photosystem II stability/assembly factor-like uncharacterized protein